MYYLKNAGLSTCFGCDGKSITLNALFNDDEKLISLYCPTCGAKVENIEDETRFLLEKRKDKIDITS